MAQYRVLSENNRLWVNYFNTNIKPTILQHLDGRYRVEITGSRSIGLAYPQSDTEFAVIVPSNTTDDEKIKIVNVLLTIMRKSSDDVKNFKTKAGLHLVIGKYTDFGMWKLEATIRTEEEHEKIQSNMLQRVSEMSEDEKVNYILKMQKMFLENDAEGMLKMKAWMKVL